MCRLTRGSTALMIAGRRRTINRGVGGAPPSASASTVHPSSISSKRSGQAPCPTCRTGRAGTGRRSRRQRPGAPEASLQVPARVHTRSRLYSFDHGSAVHSGHADVHQPEQRLHCDRDRKPAVAVFVPSTDGPQTPRVHGISGNYFYDAERDEDVHMNAASYIRAPTIFSEMERRGVKVVVGVCAAAVPY